MRSSKTRQITDRVARLPEGRAWRYGLWLGIAAAGVSIDLPALRWPLSFSNLVVVIALIMVILGSRRSGRGSARMTAFDVAFVLYLTWRLFAELVNAAELAHPVSIGLVFELSVIYLATIVARSVVQDRTTLISFFKGVLVPSVFVSVIGVLQIAGIGPVNELLLRWTSSPGLESRTERGVDLRATSTIGHWTSLGGYLIVVIALACVILVLVHKAEKRYSKFALLVLVLAVLGQFSTLTIATVIVSALVLFVTILVLGVRPIIVVPSLFATVVALWLFGDQVEMRVAKQASASRYTDQWNWLPESIAYRMHIWTNETIPAIQERAISGWGVDVYGGDWILGPESLVWISPESEWLRTAITVGLVGLMLQALTLILAWSQVLKPARKIIGSSIFPLQVAFLGLIVISFVHPHFTNRGVPLIWWIALGGVLAITQTVTQEKLKSKSLPFSSEGKG